MTAYLVFDPARPQGQRWLSLTKGTCYARWTATGGQATPLPYAQASQWAAVYARDPSTVMVVEAVRLNDDYELMREHDAAAERRLAASTPWRSGT